MAMTNNTRESFEKAFDKVVAGETYIGKFGNPKEVALWAALYAIEKCAKVAERLQEAYPTVPIEEVLLPEAIRHLAKEMRGEV